MLQPTLGERLQEALFSESDGFQVIYDSRGLLLPFLTDPDLQLPKNHKRLLLEATEEPVELLKREKIVADFDETSGWYRHQWLLYVHGLAADQLERAKTFQYYEKIGQKFHLTSLLDLFLHRKIHLIAQKTTSTPLPLEDPRVGQILLLALMDVPVECYISHKQTFIEEVGWVALLSALHEHVTGEEGESPQWELVVAKQTPVDLAAVALELIRVISPDFDQVPDDFPAILGPLFEYLSHELQEPVGALTDPDPVKNVQAIVKYLLLPLRTHQARPKKKSAFDKYFAPARADQAQLDHLKQQVLKAWFLSSDPDLQAALQEWTRRYRKDVQVPALNLQDLETWLDQEAYSGIVDVWIAATLLRAQQAHPWNEPEWKKQWTACKRARQKVWKKHAKYWWAERPLFASGSHALTVDGLWKLVFGIGCLYVQPPESPSGWPDLRDHAWMVEKFFNFVTFHPGLPVIRKERAFHDIEAVLQGVDAEYRQQSEILHQHFLTHYLNLPTTRPGYLHHARARELLDDAIHELTEGQRVGVIFCDAMRRDVLLPLVDRVKKFYKDKKVVRTSEDPRVEDAVVLLPSETSSGWTSVLTYTDRLTYHLAEDEKGKLQAAFAITRPGGERENLATKDQREHRLAGILSKSGCDVQVRSFDPIRVITAKLSTLHRELSPAGSSLPVPVVWYEQIDDHEQDRRQFATRKKAYVDALATMVTQLHRAGIHAVYVFTDHGFMFRSNADAVPKSERPAGTLKTSYVLSGQAFPPGEGARYPHWAFFRPTSFHVKVEIQSPTTPDFTIIVPREGNTFRKIGGKDQFTHGGLSYQECDISFLKSKCEIYATATPVLAAPGHEKLGPETYILKDAGPGAKKLEIEIRAQEAGAKQKVLPLHFRLVPREKGVTIVPSNEQELKKNSKLTFEAYVDESHLPPEIHVQVRDAEENLVAEHAFKIHASSVPDLF